MKAATVVTTKEFESSAKGLLSEDELAWMEFSLATNPTAHPIIPGTGGVRKARWGYAGSGKRAGLRIIYFYAFSAGAVLLLSAYGKNQKEDLSNEDKKNIRCVVEAFKASIEA